MVYEWDEKRARRTYWTRLALTGAGCVAAIGASLWIADAFGVGKRQRVGLDRAEGLDDL